MIAVVVTAHNQNPADVGIRLLAAGMTSLSTDCDSCSM